MVQGIGIEAGRKSEQKPDEGWTLDFVAPRLRRSARPAVHSHGRKCQGPAAGSSA